MRMRRSALCGLIVAVLWAGRFGFAEVSVSLSVGRVKAGGRVSLSGAIEPGEELHIVIASKEAFAPAGAPGQMERARLTKAAQECGFEKETAIPYLYYIVTSNPEHYGEVKQKTYGGAFFFKGMYKTRMFKLKEWKDIPDHARDVLVPIKTEEQWNLLRYAHENTFGINTVVKERTCRGKVVIFSRCVVADEERHAHYWNEGTRVALDQATGEFSAEFRTFAHTRPGTDFEVYANGTRKGEYVVEGRGLWLPRGWRYVNPLAIVLGAIVAGTFYSMLGASGGLLMAAFQIMLVGTAGPLGVNGANVLKPSNLPLTFTAPIAALYRYWIKERRLALPAALAFAVGIFLGAFMIGPPLSSKYLNMSSYKPWLGVLVVIMAARTIYELTPYGMKRRKSVRGVMNEFNAEVKKAKEEGRAAKMGRLETIRVGLTDYRFRFWGHEFRINILLFVCVGAVIGIVSSSFGIGGGFLLVPAMTILGGLPMYVAVPISLFSSIMGSSSGMVRYALMGYYPDPWLVLFIVVGGLFGGLIGSRLHGLFSEKQLKTMLVIVLLFIVLRFWQIEIWI